MLTVFYMKKLYLIKKKISLTRVKKYCEVFMWIKLAYLYCCNTDLIFFLRVNLLFLVEVQRTYLVCNNRIKFQVLMLTFFYTLDAIE